MLIRIQSFKTLITLLLILGSYGYSFASHAVGVDLTYQYVSANRYKIRLALYRDCLGNSDACPKETQDTISVGVEAPGCYFSALRVVLNKLPSTGQLVSPVCPGTPTTCNDPGNPQAVTGIKEYVYEGTVTLPFPCKNWTISYFIIARNTTDALQGLANNYTQSLYIESVIDNSFGVGKNSSPQLTNKPVPFICIGQNFCFNNGAVDPDGDSLAYAMSTPLQIPYAENGPVCSGPNVNGWKITGNPGPVTYKAGYSALNPITNNGTFVFNGKTGDWCVTPIKKEITNMTIIIREYRKGVLIGSIIRDIQVNIIDCNNKIPNLSGINGHPTKQDTIVCANKAFCFDITTTDADANQNVTLSWNSGIPTGSFTSSGGSRPTGTFCWTPKATDVNGQTKSFTVQVKDNNCPINGFQTKSYNITVLGPKVELGNDTTVCTAPLTIKTKYPDPAYSYLWSNGATTSSISISTSGKYWIRVTGNTGCDISDTINVKVGAIQFSAGTNQTLCSGDSVVLDAGPGYLTYNWAPVGKTTQQITAKTSGKYIVTVTNALCSGKDTVDLVFNPTPVITANGPTVSCAAEKITIGATSNLPNTSYLWAPTGPVDDATKQNPTVFPSTTTTFTVSGSVSGGCSNSATITVTIAPSPTLSVSDKTYICKGESGVLTASGATSYTWAPATWITSGINSGTITIKPDSAIVYIVTGKFNACTQTAVVAVEINPVPTILVSPSSTICFGESKTLTVSGANNYTWTPTTSLSTSTGNSVIATPGSSTSYTVCGSDFTCTSSNSVSIFVNPLPIISITGGSSTSICATTSTTITATGATNYTWTPAATLNTSSGSIVIANPLVTTTYTVTGKDGDACLNTNTVTVTVKPLPSITLNAGTGAICLGKSVSITASGADTYTWSPTDVTLNTDSTVATDTPSNTKKYTVKGTDSNGCSNETSTTIIVNDIVPGVVSISPIPICDEAVTLWVTVTNVASYTWTPSTGLSCTGCPNPVVKPSGETMVYTVEVTTNCGTQKNKTDVMVRQCIYIPNVITGKIGNDRFIIRNLKDYPNSSLQIYDRWGVKLLDDNNYNNTWDGETYPDGTYFYVLNLSDGTIHRGTIQIIKHN